jgi:hypothetical protein
MNMLKVGKIERHEEKESTHYYEIQSPIRSCEPLGFARGKNQRSFQRVSRPLIKDTWSPNCWLFCE